MADQSSQTKPPKLRAACNQCNSSKVKCSGDRDGCIRCSTLRVECVYGESRVGKVQPPRRRKKSQQVSAAMTTSPRPQHNLPTPMQTPSIASSSNHDNHPRFGDAIDICRPTTHTSNGTEASTLEDALQNWTSEHWTSTSWDGDMVSLDDPVGLFDDFTGDLTTSASNASGSEDMPTASLASSRRIGSSTTSTNESVTSRQGSDRNFRHSFSVNSPKLTPNLTMATASSSRVATEHEGRAKTPAKPTSKLDSKCLLACTQILITLENYIISELKALDLVLGAVRKACDELRRLIKYQQQSRCDRCLFLFVAIMHQVVELLEAGTQSMDSDSDDSMELDIGDVSNANFMPSFGFGGFSVSAEEQRRWKAQLIRREVQHIEEAFKCLVELSKMGPGCAGDDLESIEQRANCLSALEQRFRETCERILR